MKKILQQVKVYSNIDKSIRKQFKHWDDLSDALDTIWDPIELVGDDVIEEPIRNKE